MPSTHNVINTAIHQFAPLSFDNFCQQVDRAFFPMTCEPNRDYQHNFSASLQSAQLGSFGIASVTGSPLDVYRQRQHISEVSDEVYLVKVQVSGESLVMQRDREAHLRPGDFALCLSSEPYQLHFADSYAQAVLAIPATLMEECVHQPQAHVGVRMDASEGANGVFSQLVTSIVSRLDSLDSNLSQRLEANVIDLLSTTLAFSPLGQQQQLVTGGVKSEYLHRIKQFIRMHLDDERLGPEWIARSQNISTRYLHMLFETEPCSVSRFIQKQRLEQCRLALSSDSYADSSVADVGYRFGFQDASHFSRAFKAEYGQTPAQYRKCLTDRQGLRQ